MYISTSNRLTELNTTITEDAGANPLSYLLNKDFSEIYRSGTSSNFFRIELDGSDLGYIGIAGLDVMGKVSTIDFEYWNGTQYVIDKTYDVESDATIMHINERYQYAEKWRVTFTKILSNSIIGIAYLAAGDSWNVPRGGYQAGHASPWTVPQYKQRTQVSLGMPTSSVIESMGVKASLKISNILTTDVVEVWGPLQDFSVTDGLFIVEQEYYGDRAYYCYNCLPKPATAHSQTRSLKNVSLSFTAWTGRTI